MDDTGTNYGPEEYYNLPLHEQNLIDRDMTQEEYNTLPDYEQRLVDKGLPTLAETKEYRKTVKWVPYNEYMERIFHHCPGRQFDEFNILENHFDKQLEPDRLLREAAYLLSLKHRPCHNSDSTWTEEDQLELEKWLYTRFRGIEKEWGD